MLVEFSVANFRSIRERQTLSLVAAPAAKELNDRNVMEAGAPATPPLLRSAVIYGANAAGKSNLILALEFVRSFVRDSARESQLGDAVEITPFLMDADSSSQPSEFELIFVQGGVRYQYGFTVNRHEVLSEWLSAYPEGRPQRWFERGLGDELWFFGSNFRGQKQVWKDLTRKNALFLSTAVQFNADQLTPVFEWFRDRLRIISPGSHISSSFSVHQCENDEAMRGVIANFLRAADIDIDAIECERRKVNAAALPDHLPEDLRARLLDQGVVNLRIRHKTPIGTHVALDIDDESQGTRKLFALAGPWLDVLANGWVLLVDELDTSLHPHVMRHVVQMFNDPAVNLHQAQLIFSTHDTSILDPELFRRDQIWFVEKDAHLQSRLYPLTDFSPRKGENFGRGYLQGRYGAVPFVGELRV